MNASAQCFMNLGKTFLCSAIDIWNNHHYYIIVHVHLKLKIWIALSVCGAWSHSLFYITQTHTASEQRTDSTHTHEIPQVFFMSFNQCCTFQKSHPWHIKQHFFFSFSFFFFFQIINNCYHAWANIIASGWPRCLLST